MRFTLQTPDGAAQHPEQKLLFVRELLQLLHDKPAQTAKLEEESLSLQAAIKRLHTEVDEKQSALKACSGLAEQLASNRALYQEMDEKETACMVAMRQADDLHERNRHFHFVLDSLREALPRLFVKLCLEDGSQAQSMLRVDQLPDAFKKIEDEVQKRIKACSLKLAQNYKGEDVHVEAATASALSDSMASDMDLLMRHPGYVHMQRQLFYNLMMADPETAAEQNVRIRSASANPGSTGDKGGATEKRRSELAATLSMSNGGGEGAADGRLATNALNRADVKALSKLIVERDKHMRAPPPKPTQKKRLGPYKPKFIEIK